MKNNKKVAIVLGAIKGIGKEIAMSLLKQEINIAISYYDWEESLEDLKKDIKKKNCIIEKVDLRSFKETQNFIKKIIKQYGKIDILINNIERGGWPIVHGKYTDEQWNIETETTLKAKWNVFEAVFPYIKKSDDGIIINISSIAGIVGRSGPASHIFNDCYSALNRSVSMFTENWAKRCAPNVRVNEIMIGFFETRHGKNTRGWGLLSKKQKKNLIDHTLLKRMGTFDDIIKAIHFLIYDAPFMTGSIIKLDGGYTFGSNKVCDMPLGEKDV